MEVSFFVFYMDLFAFVLMVVVHGMLGKSSAISILNRQDIHIVCLLLPFIFFSLSIFQNYHRQTGLKSLKSTYLRVVLELKRLQALT